MSLRKTSNDVVPTEDTAGAATMSAMKRLAVIFAISIGCVGCDLVTKHAARQLLQGRETISLMGDFLRLVYVENVGGFLGLGSALSQYWRTGLFLLLAVSLVAALLTYAVTKRNIVLPRLLAVALIVGGGFGNIIDRIVNDGGVVDFLNLGIGSLRTGIFNVADMAIMLGVLILLLSSARAERREAA